MSLPAPPPVPPAAPAPEKKKTKRWPWVLGALIVAVVGLSLLGDADTNTDNTDTTGTDATACIYADRASDLATHAGEALTAGGQAAIRGDADTALAEVRIAADDFHEIADLTTADAGISALSENAARHLDASADAIIRGQWTLATNELDAATAAINQANDAIRSTDVPAC